MRSACPFSWHRVCISESVGEHGVHPENLGLPPSAWQLADGGFLLNSIDLRGYNILCQSKFQWSVH